MNDDDLFQPITREIWQRWFAKGPDTIIGEERGFMWIETKTPLIERLERLCAHSWRSL